MKMLNYYALALAGITAATLHAAPFSAGSNGSLGAITITSNTVMDLPADGKLHFTAFTVQSGRTLTFNRNPLNTPVRILSQGEIRIDGTITLNGGSANTGAPGRGAAGGFDGGFGGYGNVAPSSLGGDGTGPGRGRRTSPPYNHGAAHVDVAGPNTNIYGSALIVPLIGGSGGAGSDGNPGQGGGGGGGAILLASDTRITLNGIINAVGGNGGGGGSGGAIRMVSPIVTGDGTFNVNGGGGSYHSGAGGRVRIDCEDRYAFRSLRFNGRVTQGSQMFVEPPAAGVLHITEAAGQTIPVPAAAGVQVSLPAGSSQNRQVKVAGNGFAANVPISVVVTPENGPSTVYNAEIPIVGGNGEATVDVVIPVGGVTQIHAWTR
jgi:hypothetical protein